MSTTTQKMGPFKMGVMGLQHMFAMFGATILVPLLTGLSIQVTLIAVGVGTLIFHFFAKGRVPAFLGSSFAFMAGIQLISSPNDGLFAGSAQAYGLEAAEHVQAFLPYATGAILVSALLYIVFAVLVKLVGVKRFMKAVPTVVTAPTVVLIGITLAPHAINQASTNIILAAATLIIIIVASSWGKGMVKIIPILLGLAGAYIIALIMNAAGATNADGSALLDFSATSYSSIVGMPDFFLPRFNIWAI
ncbi:MAG: uracil-xanthine permease, partial [Defluviitaleaceae bacterium]|nr:uracil-xanthine permease [Defluviitaleaceae bacterium]